MVNNAKTYCYCEVMTQNQIVLRLVWFSIEFYVYLLGNHKTSK